MYNKSICSEFGSVLCTITLLGYGNRVMEQRVRQKEEKYNTHAHCWKRKNATVRRVKRHMTRLWRREVT